MQIFINTVLCPEIDNNTHTYISHILYFYKEWGDGSEEDLEPQEVNVPLDYGLRRRRSQP